MPKHSRTLHNEFSIKVQALDATRQSFENAFVAHLISDADIIQGYAGLYLDLFTEFEGLIENLFIGILSGSVTPNNTIIKRKLTIKPVSEIEPVLLGERRAYLDWLPYANNTIRRANIYFNGGKPFTLLDDIGKGKITTYHKIRNAIAHKSKKANNEFQKIIDGLTLLPIERTPQGYLRNIPNASTGMTQLEIIGNELIAISHKLCN
ncbi:MAG: hypothetical protein JRE23_05480 [Deltaproteobacteria bacterium]|nr:hypothetical protein [Deltaproteobacteria bacterium]